MKDFNDNPIADAQLPRTERRPSYIRDPLTERLERLQTYCLVGMAVLLVICVTALVWPYL